MPMRQGGGVNRIDADVLIPGVGAPMAAATVLTEGGTISHVGPTAGLGTGARTHRCAHVAVVMPGMRDCHCHLYGIRRFSVEEMLITPVPTVAARAAKDAQTALQAGFTSLREAGVIGIWLVPAVDGGTISGPSIYSVGSVLSPTGGHADVHTLPAGWVAGAYEDGRFLQLGLGRNPLDDLTVPANPKEITRVRKTGSS
jgi:imidazolonepropionase-like amidohydrolase